MESKEVTMKVEKSKDVKSLSNEEKLKQLHIDFNNKFTEFERLTESNSRKKYLVSGGKETQEHLLKFLDTDAKWKSHEALGVIRAFNEVDNGLEKKELFLGPLCIEAIAYYMDKVEGVGLKEANDYKSKLFDPINEVYGKVQADREEIKKLQADLGQLETEVQHYETAVQQGVEIED